MVRRVRLPTTPTSGLTNQRSQQSGHAIRPVSDRPATSGDVWEQILTLQDAVGNRVVNQLLQVGTGDVASGSTATPVQQQGQSRRSSSTRLGKEVRQRISRLVQTAIRELNDSRSEKVLLSSFLAAGKLAGRAGMKQFALELQSRPHQSAGNYLAFFFLRVSDFSPVTGERIRNILAEEGVSVSPAAQASSQRSATGPKNWPEVLDPTPTSGGERFDRKTGVYHASQLTHERLFKIGNWWCVVSPGASHYLVLWPTREVAKARNSPGLLIDRHEFIRFLADADMASFWEVVKSGLSAHKGDIAIATITATGVRGARARTVRSRPSKTPPRPAKPPVPRGAVDAAGRLPRPPLPRGYKGPLDFGVRGIRWGHGPQMARDRIQTLTREQLKQARITQRIARKWRDFYRHEAARTGNPTAEARADLMQRAVELLSGK